MFIGERSILVGIMSFVVIIDRKGRILLPKKVREMVGLDQGGYVRVKVEGERVIIEPIGSIAEEYFGAYKVGKWPEDLDSFMVETVRRWWASRGT